MEMMFDCLKNNRSTVEIKKEISALLTDICKQVERIATINEDGLIQQCETYEERTSRKEYGSGGLSFHRGFYLPSPIQDIYTDNANRGRILKRITSRSRISYEYCYDESDKLFFVIETPTERLKSCEWIKYDDCTCSETGLCANCG